MAAIETTDRVVVGTDASPTASHAVEWAARAALERGKTLLIVSVIPEYPLPKRSSIFNALGKDTDFLERVQERGSLKLAAEELRVRTAHPELPIEKHLVRGQASYVLARATRDADLVVVGARGHSAPLRVRALGGVSDAVATHAHGLVAVVPEEAGTPHGPIVVGVDDAPEAIEALHVAFTEAERRGVPLEAIHAWEPAPTLTDPTFLTSILIADVHESLEALTDDLLRPFMAEHPDVEVRRRIEMGHPASVLIAASHDASVLVVGSRGRGGFAGLLLGSTSREVLRGAFCPVLVTRAREVRAA